MRGGDDANPQASRDNDLISKMKVYHEAISGRVGGELGWMVQNIIIAFVPVLAQVFVPSFRKWATPVYAVRGLRSLSAERTAGGPDPRGTARARRLLL